MSTIEVAKNDGEEIREERFVLESRPVDERVLG